MARIQILELPMEHVGEYSKTPFDVVIDQVDEDEARAFDGVKDAVGAVGAIVTTGTLDIA